MSQRTPLCLLILLCLLEPLNTFGQPGQNGGPQLVKTEKKPEKEPNDALDLDKVNEGIIKRTNELRQREKQEPLKANPQLAKAAQDFAEVLATLDKLDHNADGKQPWDRTAEAGYKHSLVSENIAYQSTSAKITADELAEKFLESWENSPGHRKNLLDPHIMDLGVGLARSETTGRYYAVQNFGRLKSANITFKIVNQTESPVRYSLDGESFTIDPRFTISFERGRPPELLFLWDETDEVSESARQKIQPVKGASYTIRKSDEDVLRIDTEK